MKNLILITTLIFGTQAFATVDSNTNVYIPVQHVQTGEFFVQKAPFIGCYGLPRGAELVQLTKPYFVNNLGCGMESTEDINALSCAKEIGFEEADDYSTFKQITLDISACPEKNNADFISAVEKVVRLNFATKLIPNPKLILKK